MTIIQYPHKALNLAAVEASLRHDEKVASTNATVITDRDGNVTGWFDGDVPVRFIPKED